MAYLYQLTASSRKFWSIRQRGRVLHTQYGRLGSEGNGSEKAFADPAQANVELHKQLRQKLGKGYLFPLPQAEPQPAACPRDLLARMPAVRGFAMASYVPSLEPLVLAYGYQNRLFFSAEADVQELEVLVKRLLTEPGYRPPHRFLDDPAAWQSLLWTLFSGPNFQNFHVSNLYEVYLSLAKAALVLLGPLPFLSIWLDLISRLESKLEFFQASFLPVLQPLRHAVASLDDADFARAHALLHACYQQARTQQHFGVQVMCNYLLPGEQDWAIALVQEYRQQAPILSRQANQGGYLDSRRFQRLRSHAEMLLYCQGLPEDHLWLYRNTFAHYDEGLQAFWQVVIGEPARVLFAACLDKFTVYMNESAARRDARSTCHNLLRLGSPAAVQVLCDFVENTVVADVLAECCVRWPLFMQGLLSRRRSQSAPRLYAGLDRLQVLVAEVLAEVPADLDERLLQLEDPQQAAALYEARLNELRASGRCKAKPGALPSGKVQLSKSARALLPVMRGVQVPEQRLELCALPLDFGIAYHELRELSAPLQPLQDCLLAGAHLEQATELQEARVWPAFFRAALQTLHRSRFYRIRDEVAVQLQLTLAAALRVLGAVQCWRTFLPVLRSVLQTHPELTASSLHSGLALLRHAVALLPEAEHQALLAETTPPVDEPALTVAIAVVFVFVEQQVWTDALLATRLPVDQPLPAHTDWLLLQDCACALPQAQRLHALGVPWTEAELALRVLENATDILPLFADWLQCLQGPDSEAHTDLDELLRKFFPAIPCVQGIALLAEHLQQPVARQLLADLTLPWPEPVAQAVFSQPRPPLALYVWLQLLA